MATPVKAFTDPTGLTGGFLGQVPVTGSSPISAGFQFRAITLPALQWPFTLPVRMPTQLLGQLVPKIPLPPMGRLMIATFPSIYKEKTSNRPDHGLQWPRSVKP